MSSRSHGCRSAMSYRQKIKLAGVIYLHRISDNRMSASAWKNIELLENLCGERAMRNIVLVTTMWGEVKEDKGTQRERELHGEYWRPMLDKRTKAMRFQDTTESAWTIADSILGTDPSHLDLQKDLVDGQKSLSETRAGILLRKPPKKRLGRLAKNIRGLFSR